MSIWDNIVYKLPKEVELSQDLKERALGYIEIKYIGHSYYVPITKELKKIVKFKVRKGIIIFDYDMRNKLEDYIRDIVNSIYLQVRDVVCAGIHQSLTQEMHDGFDKLFRKPLWNEIEKRANKKMLLKDKNL